MGLDQNPLFIPGMFEEHIEMISLEMQIVESVCQFLFVDTVCGRHCPDEVVVAEQPGRQQRFRVRLNYQCFRVRLNFEKYNFVDSASGLLVIMNKFNISLEIVTACMVSDHTY